MAAVLNVLRLSAAAVRLPSAALAPAQVLAGLKPYVSQR